MEDQKVAERLCSIWEYIKNMTKYRETLPKSKLPKCKGYNTVVERTKDELTLAKLEFFGYITSLLQNILVKYQMPPFLFEDLFSIAKSLMDLIIKPDVLSSIVSGSQLQNFDFTEKENFLPLKSITIGFAAERNMELRRKDVLSQDEVRRLMKDCHVVVIGILEKYVREV